MYPMEVILIIHRILVNGLNVRKLPNQDTGPKAPNYTLLTKEDFSINRLLFDSTLTADPNGDFHGPAFFALSKNDSSIYANIVDRTLRYRFYHNYSYYRVGHNYFGYFLAPFIKKDLSAIVLPNDILKCPNAACSQQSIIGMELFRKKGYSVRKVGFFDKKYGGHFCFEANYDDNWHFFDPDKEPNYELLLAFNRPSFAYIHSNHLLLHGLYNTTDKDCVDSLFSKPFYGIANQFPAKNARIYQYVTKFFSYTLWLWLILFYFYFYRPKNK